jgi:hypothetical protein
MPVVVVGLAVLAIAVAVVGETARRHHHERGPQLARHARDGERLDPRVSRLDRWDAVGRDLYSDGERWRP